MNVSTVGIHRTYRPSVSYGTYPQVLTNAEGMMMNDDVALFITLTHSHHISIHSYPLTTNSVQESLPYHPDLPNSVSI